MFLLSEYKCSVASLREGKKKPRQCQTGLSCLCSVSTSDFSFKDSCYLWTGINFRTPVLAWDSFYNLPQVQLRSLAVLQTLHINSKLRQQQRQTHYTGKKEKVFWKTLPSFHFCLRKHCRAAHAVFPLARQGHIQPPDLCSNQSQREMGQAVSGLQNSKEGKECKWHLLQLGRKTSQTWSTSCSGMCASGQDKPKALVLQELPWRARWSPKLLGKPCCWPLLQWWQCSATPPSITAPSQRYSEAPVIPFPLMTRVYSFLSYLIPWRCTGAAPFLQHSLALMNLAALIPIPLQFQADQWLIPWCESPISPMQAPCCIPAPRILQERSYSSAKAIHAYTGF